MRRLGMLLGLCGVVLIVGVGIAIAQDSTCPAVIEAAFEQTVDVCDGTGVLCYGNAAAVIALHMISSLSAPAAPGEFAPLNHVQSFRTLPFDADSGTYGVVLARRDSSGDDDVQFLFFGDVEVIVGADPVVGMDSFTFRSGLYDSPCEGAPDSGLLIYAPGNAPASTVINGVNINLMGTVFVQAQPGVDLAVQVIGGQAEVGYGDSTVMVGVGESARVSLTNDLTPIGDVLVKDYELVTTLALPLDVLPQVTTVQVSEELPLSGEWRIISDTCELHLIGQLDTITVAADGQSFQRENANYQLVEPGRYRFSYGTEGWWEAVILSPTLLEFTNQAGCQSRSEWVSPSQE